MVKKTRRISEIKSIYNGTALVMKQIHILDAQM